MKRHKFYDDKLHVRILDFLLLTPFGYILSSVIIGITVWCLK